jgi:hypothetical protein
VLACSTSRICYAHDAPRSPRLSLAMCAWPARCAMDPTFGARLRLQRERQQIALTTIADQTKIKLSLLEALERDDVSRWPRGIFRRSYVRTYARAIGLEPDSTVREFLEFHPDSVDEILAAQTEAANIGAESGSRRPPMRLRFLIGSAINALPALHLQPGQKSLPAVQPAPAPGALSVEREASTVVPATATAAVAPCDAAAGHTHCRVDFSALADLCTRLGRAHEVGEVAPALQDAVSALDAVGLMLWMPDPRGSALTPVLAHGYSDEVLAQLPRVPSHTDNAIAAAFRSVETRVVNGSESVTGALVVPLPAPTGCSGVLAFEFRDGAEQHECVRTFAIILAAQLSTLFEPPALAQAVNA